MGNGRRVKFWIDRWYVEEPLCNPFPSLYALVLSREVWVVDLWEDLGGGGLWSLHFSRHVNDFVSC